MRTQPPQPAWGGAVGVTRVQKVGSIAAGGRCDNMACHVSHSVTCDTGTTTWWGSSRARTSPPLVRRPSYHCISALVSLLSGVSIGIERVMAIMEAKAKQATSAPPRRNKTDVLVTCIGSNLLPHRMRLCSALWAAGVNAEFPYAPTHP